MPSKPKSELRQKIEDMYEEHEYASIAQNKYRARSVTVGTAFGGVCELILRSDGATVWAQMQPVEVVELIEQLAAGAGLQVAMRPRVDFASWRGWNVDVEDPHAVSWKGSAPWQIAEAPKRRRLSSSSKKKQLKESKPKEASYPSNDNSEEQSNDTNE